MTIDYAAVLADLEARRAGLDAAIAAIAPLVDREGHSAAVSDAAPRQKATAKPKAKRAKRKSAPATPNIVEAQRLYEKERVKLPDIARRLKIPYQTLYYQSRKWTAPTNGTAKAAADHGWME